MLQRTTERLGALLWVVGFLAVETLRSVRENYRLAIISLALAVALWFFVGTDQTLSRQGTFPVQIPVELVNKPAYLEIYPPGSVEPVTVRISAPEDSWSRLRPTSFRAVADLRNSKEGVQQVPVQVTSSDPDVRILQVSPPAVTVRLEPIRAETLTVRVELEGSPPVGYINRTPSVSPETVTIRGADPVVRQVRSAVAVVRLESARSTIVQNVPVRPIDAQGNPVSGLTVDPELVTVRVPVDQVLVQRQVSVIVAVTGDPAPGYWLQSINVDPAIVTIVGASEAVENINNLRTEPISIDGLTSTQVRNVRLILPDGVTVLGQPAVNVRLTIAPTSGTRTFQIAPLVLNLAPGLRAQVDPFNVTVSGPLPLLNATDPQAIAVTVDAAGLGPGTYDVTPRVTLPDGLGLVRVQPDRRTLTISR
jgi:YbbR domain-containing protein